MADVHNSTRDETRSEARGERDDKKTRQKNKRNKKQESKFVRLPVCVLSESCSVFDGDALQHFGFALSLIGSVVIVCSGQFSEKTNRVLVSEEMCSFLK